MGEVYPRPGVRGALRSYIELAELSGLRAELAYLSLKVFDLLLSSLLAAASSAATATIVISTTRVVTERHSSFVVSCSVLFLAGAVYAIYI